MDGETYIMGNRINILLSFGFIFFGCEIHHRNIEGLYIEHGKETVDSLFLYKNNTFFLIVSDYDNARGRSEFFGSWSQNKKRLFLSPENSIEKIDEKVDTSLNNSISIRTYDYNNERILYAFEMSYLCYSKGQIDTIKFHDHTSKNLIIPSNKCDSITSIPLELLYRYNDFKWWSKSVIIPIPNVSYTVYLPYTWYGYFLERDFYLKKRGRQIYVRWDKKTDNKYDSKGYLWLEKVEY